MSVEKKNGIGLFGQFADKVKSTFAKSEENMQNESGDTEVNFVLIQDDGEEVPEITEAEILEAQKEIEDAKAEKSQGEHSAK